MYSFGTVVCAFVVGLIVGAAGVAVVLNFYCSRVLRDSRPFMDRLNDQEARRLHE